MGAIFTANNVKVVEGADAITRFKTSPGFERCFCKVCGTTIMGQGLDEKMPVTVVSTACFVDADTHTVPSQLAPTSHLYYNSRILDVHDDFPKFRALVVDDAGALLQPMTPSEIEK